MESMANEAMANVDLTGFSLKINSRVGSNGKANPKERHGR